MTHANEGGKGLRGGKGLKRTAKLNPLPLHSGQNAKGQQGRGEKPPKLTPQKCMQSHSQKLLA